MKPGSRLRLQAQPDDTVCGPTCLQAIYAYWGIQRPLGQLIKTIHRLPSGGTLAVFLANHALASGFRVTLYTYNLHIFDPTWFHPTVPDLADRLGRQALAKPRARLRAATKGYLRFLEAGGRLCYEDLTANLISDILGRGIPILAGLSSTYLYRACREEDEGRTDDVLGEPEGHFVILRDYDPVTRQVSIADPYRANPIEEGLYYTVGMDRLLGAILLGVLTHDANFLVMEPDDRKEQ